MKLYRHSPYTPTCRGQLQQCSFFLILKAIKSAQNTLLIVGHVLSLVVSYGAGILVIW